MATYNLAASDLITLLSSTVQTQTGKAILESVESALNAFPFGNTNVQIVNGPANTVPGAYTIMKTDTITDNTGTPLDTLPAQLVLITTPNSVLPGSTNTSGTATLGTELTSTSIALTDTVGGVIIAAGDQNVAISDLNKTTKSDTLIGGAYKEKLSSFTGNNLLVAGSGANTLDGGSGADTLLGAGNSRLNAGSGANTLLSSTLATGHDTLVGSSGASLLVSQAGNNRLTAGTGANTLKSGPGVDTLFGGGGHADILLGSGSPKVRESVAGTHDTIMAGSGSDTVALTFGVTGIADSIVGSNGSLLRVVDLAGTNTIVAGSGFVNIVLSTVVGGVTQTNTSNQTITAGPAGSAGVRIQTTDSLANYSATSAPGGVYTVKFSDQPGQVLTINDASGTSVKIQFGNGSTTII